MPVLDIPVFFGLLAVLLATALILGQLARWVGQPAVLGELLAGVLLGGSVIGLIDLGVGPNPPNEALQLLAHIGVMILLFEIGLQTDWRRLLKVGGEAAVVAVVGVVLPFVLGYALCRLLGLANLESIVAGAALTATSVGITARVLSDLGHLHERESQIILGAAVLDDILGLIILTVVGSITRGQPVTAWRVLAVTGIALGLLVGTLVVGRWVVPPIFRLIDRGSQPRISTTLALILLLGLAWLAHVAGSAVIIGAFAAGLLLRETPQAAGIERGVAGIGYFFVPLFFVVVGAGVDVRTFNPWNPANAQTVVVGGLLIVAAVVGKFVAGYAPWWFRGRKAVIGVGMIPRGEVGLIFAQLGLVAGVFGAGLFSAVTLVVMVTTFVTPPLLKLLFQTHGSKNPAGPSPGNAKLTTEP